MWKSVWGDLLYSVSHKMAAIKPNVFGYGPVRIKIKWLLMYRLKKGGGNLARVDYFTIGFSVLKRQPRNTYGPTSDGGSCRQCHTNVWHRRKYGDIRWNHIPISFRSKVISVSGLVAAIFQFRMPNHIRSAISRPRSKSGMVEKVGLAV